MIFPFVCSRTKVTMALDVIEGKIGMLELSPPVTFEPVGPVTTVFFDDKNQQARATQEKKKN